MKLSQISKKYQYIFTETSINLQQHKIFDLEDFYELFSSAGHWALIEARLFWLVHFQYVTKHVILCHLWRLLHNKICQSEQRCETDLDKWLGQTRRISDSHTQKSCHFKP